jgi:hypothetical protein
VVASPTWSDAQKVVGVAYSPGGHLADGVSHQLVQTIIDRAVAAPPCPRQHGSTRGLRTQDHPIADFTRILADPPVRFKIAASSDDPVSSAREFDLERFLIAAMDVSISSIRVPDGWTVTLYDKDDFTGEKLADLRPRHASAHASGCRLSGRRLVGGRA